MSSLYVSNMYFSDSEYVDVFLCKKMFFTIVADNCLTKKRDLNRKNMYTRLVIIATVIFVLVFMGYITVYIIERRNKSDAR